MAHLPAAEWFATLPTVFVSTGALVTSPDGRVLLVRARYRDHWGFPGGVIDHGETPDAAVVRETAEEVGLTVEAGALLVLDWDDDDPERPHPLAYFVFDCGTVAADTALRFVDGEIAEAEFLDVDAARRRMSEHGRRRLPAALAARSDGRTRFSPR